MAQSLPSGSAVIAAPRVIKRRPLGSVAIVVAVIACLVIGHLALKTHFPSFAVNVVGIALVGLIMLWVLSRDVFAFLLMLFACSQFRYADNQGGLFTLIAFPLLLLHVFTYNVRETRFRSDPPVFVLLIVLFTMNAVGLVLRNPMPAYMIALQAVSFSGFLLAFHVSSHINLDETRLKQLLSVIAVMVAFNFLASLNQHYLVVKAATPILGLSEELFYKTTNAYGTFGSSSASAQHAMMMLAFLLPLMAASASRIRLKMNPALYIPVAIICVAIMVLANMRAAALESIVLIVIYSAMFTIFYRRSFRYSRYINIFSATLVFLLVSFGTLVGLEYMLKELQEVKISSIEDIETGEAINRAGAWSYGVQLIENGSWWVGFGHGVAESNTIAWGGKRALAGSVGGGGHLHNLYLALPTLYGWLGSVAYISLFLLTVFRLLTAVKKHSFDRLMTVVCLGFLMSLILFLVDEFKAGNAVQYINYPMIVFIWLGLAIAAVRTLKSETTAVARARA